MRSSLSEAVRVRVCSEHRRAPRGRTVDDHLAVNHLKPPLGDDESLGPIVTLAEDGTDQLLVVLIRAVNGRSVDEGAALTFGEMKKSGSNVS